jgi:hypothetical protein
MAHAPWAVILCSFSDVAVPDMPISFFVDAVTPGTGGLADYWRDVSYTQTSLTGSRVYGWFPMKYSFVHDGRDPYKDPSASVRQAWIDEAKRLATGAGIDLAKYWGVIAVVNANVVDSNSGRDVAVGVGGSWGQNHWKWCANCQALTFAGGDQIGACPGPGGFHVHEGSGDYSLALNQIGFPGEDNWLWCSKCQGLTYAGNAPSPCPATGVHYTVGSGSYSLGYAQSGPPGDLGWRRCWKCQMLVYIGNPSLGACAAGGVHDASKGSDYTVVKNENHFNLTFLAHETGHAYGLGHSWSAKPEEEYGNPWDIMSAMSVATFADSSWAPGGPGAAAPHLDFLGWVPDFAAWTNGPAHTGTETIRLQPLNQPGLGHMMATATRRESTYYVEYRQPNGWDRAFRRSGVFINEVRDWRWCSRCQELTSTVAQTPGPCPAGGSHAHVGSSYYTLLHDGPPEMASQGSWQWCSRCEALIYTGGSSMGVCPAGGTHQAVANGTYRLVHDQPSYGQSNWRHCRNCEALFFAQTSRGVCPLGGPHDPTGSSDYGVFVDVSRHPFLVASAMGNQDFQPGQVFIDRSRSLVCVIHSFDQGSPGTATVSIGNVQDNWQRCSKCQGLAFAGNPGPGSCPGGGTHVYTAGATYSLLQDLPGNAGQHDWRWCSKCQSLWFAGNGSAQCPAGAIHERTGSDYVLLRDTPVVDAQGNWRWCNKCQGLVLAGTSQGACQAGGVHALTVGSDYYLINV